MAEYIEREAAEKAIAVLMPRMSTPDGTGCGDEYILSAQEAFVDAIAAVNNIPAAEVAPVVHGNWILEEVDYGISPITNEKVISSKYRCSNCGYETGKQAERFVCCPLCTARMRKDG